MRIGAREPYLHKHEIERLMRIQRQSLKTYNAQNERVKHLEDIKKRQRMYDYEIEYDRLRAATVKTGPLHRAAVQRLGELQKMFAPKTEV